MKKFYILILNVILAASISAQDIHYSQFFNAPLLLNPALTGFMPGAYRVEVNYRNQWFAATGGGFGQSPYMTTAFGGDIPIKIKNNVLGVGIEFANDQAGANTFSTVVAMASVSYILTLGKEHKQRLSAGFQAGYTNQTIMVQNFQFASQFQDNLYNSSLSTNENIGKTHTGYLNLNAGMLWYGKFADFFGMYAGGSFYNITSPKYDILAGQTRNLYWRWNMHTGLDFALGKKYHILPSLMYENQGPDNQMNTGLGFGIDFKDEMAVTLGCYNRVNTLSGGAHPDAIIPYVSFEISGFKFGGTYDATVSSLKAAGASKGAFELSVTYVGQKKGQKYNHDKQTAPRF